MFIFNDQLIKERLEEKGLSQAEFGEKVGLKPASVTRMLQNKQKTISLEIAYEVCKLLNIKIDELIIDDNPNSYKIEEQITLDNLYNIQNEIQEFFDNIIYKLEIWKDIIEKSKIVKDKDK